MQGIPVRVRRLGCGKCPVRANILPKSYAAFKLWLHLKKCYLKKL